MLRAHIVEYISQCCCMLSIYGQGEILNNAYASILSVGRIQTPLSFLLTLNTHIYCDLSKAVCFVIS
jgi:hypothetical protein